MDEEKGAVRKRLKDLKTTDKFDAFCLDCFPKAYRQFSGGMTRIQKETHLLELFEAAEILQELDAYLRDPDPQGQETNQALTPAFPWSAQLLRGMPWHAAESIQKFLENYLGTEQQPVAFGGRKKQLEQLKTWADSPQAEPYLVLQAPTGRGKSALLCRLVQTLAQDQDTERALVFLPVSLRFGLSLAGTVLPALLERLAVLHGDSPPREPSTEAAKALLSQFLRRPLRDGRRLLVILDGLDEAGDWELGEEALPQLPPQTKVLLSLRQTHARNNVELRQRFGLKPNRVRLETLPALGLLEVSQAVRALAITDLSPADEARIAERLGKLSEGDPLVLSLLLDECQTPDGLARFRERAEIDLIPGLGELWKQMLKSSEQAALSPTSPTWTVLALLSCAWAPLTRTDLILLAECGSGEALDQALQPIHRWVLRLEKGYVFSHPRLREFVYDEKLGTEQQRQWERRFIAWGQRIVHALQNGDALVAQVPSYLMQCLTIHLQRFAAGAADWMCILSDVWKQSWEALPLGRAGLRRDIERAQLAFSRYNRDARFPGKHAPYLIEYLRCTLWVASLRSYENNLPLSLLPQLMTHELLTPAQALEHVRSHLSLPPPPMGWGASVISTVLLHLAETLLPEVVELAIDLAERTDKNTLDPLLDLLKNLTRTNLDVALLSARRLRGSLEQAKALLVIVESLREEDAARRRALQQEALKQVWKIQQPYGFLNTVPALSQKFDPDDRDALLAKAMHIAFALQPEGSRLHYLTSLFNTDLPPEQRDLLFLAAIDSACQTEGPFEIQSVLDRSTRISQTALSNGLERLIHENRSDGIVTWLFYQETEKRWPALQQLLSPSACEQVAQNACDLAEKEWLQAWRIEKLQALDIIGRKEFALAAVRATPDLRQRQTGLLQLADRIPLDETQKLIGEALSQERGSEAQRLTRLALSFLSADTFDETAEILLKTVDPAVRTSGLLALQTYAPERMTAVLSTAIETALAEVTDGEDQRELLYQLFEQRPTLERLDWILTEAAETSSDPILIANRARRLSMLARSLSEPHRTRALACMLDLLDKLPAHMRCYQIEWLLKKEDLPEPLRQRALVMFRQEMQDHHAADVLPHVPDPQEQKQILREAMSDAQKIEDEELRIETAAALCPSEPLCADLIRRADGLDTPESRFLRLARLSRSLPLLQDSAADAACSAGRSLLFSTNILARSYLIHRGNPATVQAVVQESFTRACEHFDSLAPILERWRKLPAEDTDRAYYELKNNQRSQLDELRDILRDIGPHLSTEQAARVLAEAPWFWSEIRVQAAARLPIESRTKISQEQWARARTLSGVEKAGALASLAPILPGAQLRDLVTESLAAAGFFHIRGTGMDNRAGVLRLVAPYLEECHLARAAELATQAWLTSQNGLSAFLARVPAEIRKRLGTEIYALAQALEPSKSATVLAQTAPFLGKAALTESVHRISKTNFPQGAVALADAAPQMDEPLLEAAFQQLRALSARGSSAPRDALLQASATLAAALVKRSPTHRPEALDFLEHVIQERGTKRPEFLHILCDLAPLITALSDPSTPDAAAWEVLNVASLWP